MTRGSDSLRLADSIAVISVRLVRTLRGLSRSADLSEPEVSALSAIAYSGRLLARDLAGMEGVTPATVSRLVRALEVKGLVRKGSDRQDARKQWLTATPLGKRRIEEGHARRL